MKGQRVLITGGLGFIGSNLAHACCLQGAKVTIYDSLSPASGGNMHNIDDIRHEVEIVRGDILDFEGVSHHVKGKDILFNCAASISHALSLREPWLDLDTNGRGVINLLEACRQHNPTIKFIQLGTSTQLGRQQTSCADENHPEFPMDIYSANKCVAEKYVLIYGRAYGMLVSVLRMANVYGPRAAINNVELTFNNYFIGLALKNKDITVYGDGKQKRNMTYIDDVIEGLIKASQNEKAYGEVFFCVGDEHLSVAQIAQKTVAAMAQGAQVRFIDWPRDPSKSDAGDVFLSNAKIKKFLDWQPRTDFNTGLLKTKEYYVKHLKHYLD